MKHRTDPRRPSDDKPRDTHRKPPHRHRAIPTPHRAEASPAKRHSRRTAGVVALISSAAIAVPAALAASGGLSSESGNGGSSSLFGPDLVVNGGFEQGTSGWRVNTAEQSLAITSPGAGSANAAQLTHAGFGVVIANDAVNTVQSTTAGVTYRLSALVRSSGPHKISGQLRARENRSHSLVRMGLSRFWVGTDWHRVRLDYTTVGNGDAIDVNVIGWKVPVGSALVVDDISVREMTRSDETTPRTTAPATTTAPITTAPTSTATPTTGTSRTATTNPTTSTPASSTSTAQPVGCVNNAMGIPPAGSAYVGAAVGPNDDMAGLERYLGEPLKIHRTYYSADQVDYAMRRVNDDVANGRLPWISFKLPYSWAEMANGKGDAWAIALTKRLAAVRSPVWIAFHHEPEHDGPIGDWVRMQEHLAPIVHGYSSNVAFTVIYTGWNLLFGPSEYTLQSDFPASGVDILGVDMYNSYRNGGTIKMTKTITDPMMYVNVVGAVAKAHHIPWAIGETGFRLEAAQVAPNWLETEFTDLTASNGIALSYFDSSANTAENGRDWSLHDATRLAAFKKLMPRSTKLC